MSIVIIINFYRIVFTRVLCAPLEHSVILQKTCSQFLYQQILSMSAVATRGRQRTLSFPGHGSLLSSPASLLHQQLICCSQRSSQRCRRASSDLVYRPIVLLSSTLVGCARMEDGSCVQWNNIYFFLTGWVVHHWIS